LRVAVVAAAALWPGAPAARAAAPADGVHDVEAEERARAAPPPPSPNPPPGPPAALHDVEVEEKVAPAPPASGATAGAPPVAPSPPASGAPVPAPPPPAPASPSAEAPAAAPASLDTVAGVYPSPASARPRIEVAVGVGASLDSSGLVSGLTAVPAFFAMGGFGAGVFGVDFGTFANNATGRYRAPNIPIDRLDFDGLLVIRPAARLLLDHPSYGLRVARTFGLEIGLGYERSSRVAASAEELDRYGLRVGGRIDVPLTPLGGAGTDQSELRLRLAARRLIGFSRSAFSDGAVVADTRAELFGALAVVF
jgi:hypothetical protein